MKDKIVDKKSSIQVRIDRGLHEILSSISKTRHVPIKTLLEGYIADGLDRDNVVFTQQDEKSSVIDSRKE